MDKRITNELREALMVENGRERKRRADAEAIRKGREAEVGPYRALVGSALTSSYPVIAEMLKPLSGRGSVSKGVAALVDTKLDPKVIGAVALQSMIAGASTSRSMQSVVENIGKHIEDETRLQWLKSVAPRLYAHIEKESARKGTVDYAHRRAVLCGAMERLDEAEVWIRWNHNTQVQVGYVLADIYVNLGVFQKVVQPTGKRSKKNALVLTDAAIQELATLTERMAEFVKPEFRPMTDVPVPWTTPTDGGYKQIAVPLMKRQKGADVRRLEATEMPKVYQALNAVQSTAWAVNTDVMVVAQELMREGRQMEGLPVLAAATQPVRPAELPTREVPVAQFTPEQKELLTQYKFQVRCWHDDEARRKSHAMQSITALQVAHEHSDFEAIYFPHHLDFRGRIYPIPTGLNPQAGDLGKGLLTFAEGKPLGVNGAYWLAVHGANTNGVKGTLNERADWVIENSDDICAMAADPLTNLTWTFADGGSAPFQFLAFCFEWAAYIESGESPDFESSLPIAVDGTCNGLQHFSGMLRDPIGAKATNLTRDGELSDIYSMVADRAVEIATERLKGGPNEREMAGKWLAFGIKRSTVKRGVMTTPYGVSQAGMADSINNDTLVPNQEFDWGTQRKGAALWMAAVIIEAIGDTVASANEAMTFLKGLAKVANTDKRGISWVTPAGLPVTQLIHRTKSSVIPTLLLGRVQLRFSHELDKIDTGKQSKGISPNFVHSLDAAHLMLTVCRFEDTYGPSSWAMIHDSYATHAGQTDELGKAIRESFVAMYADHCPLTALRDSVTGGIITEDTPEVPEKGDFDLTEVLGADYFFA